MKNKKILNTMKNIVKEEIFDDSPYFIGKGSSTVVYGLGKLENFKEQELFLAMRIGYNKRIYSDWQDYFRSNDILAKGEVGAFEKAFTEYGPNAASYRRKSLMPPFFAGIFYWENKKGKNLFGVLTEDLSSGGRNEVIEDEFSERGIVYSRGNTKEYFMDPRRPKCDLGEKYMKKGKIISLGRL